MRLDRALHHRPNEFAAIVLESDQPFSLAPVAHKLEGSVRLRILREQPGALPIDASWLRDLPAAERTAVFDAVGRSWRDAEGLVPAERFGALAGARGRGRGEPDRGPANHGAPAADAGDVRRVPAVAEDARDRRPVSHPSGRGMARLGLGDRADEPALSARPG